MLLQRLATGATGVKQARYRRRPTRAARHSYAHAQYLYTQPVYTVHYCVYGRSLALAVQCETTHGVYEFRRGFAFIISVIHSRDRVCRLHFHSWEELYPNA